MWDHRYATDDYAYGKAPNDFLAAHCHHLPPGRVLSLAEGEGRNAVFLALQGYAVTAVDASRVGLDKARRLADENGVALDLIHADLEDYDPGQAQWEGIVSIFCPLPREARRALHTRVSAALKPGGVFLLEAYRPEQLAYGTGGGRFADTMTSPESLEEDLRELGFLHFAALEREVIEGSYHTGLAAVVQLIARKP